MHTPQVIKLTIDPDICLAHEACVRHCPEVFSIVNGVAALNPSADQYFESHAAQILKAEADCPVNAITVGTDPPRLHVATFPLDLDSSPEGLPVVDMLEKLRSIPPRRSWWAFWRS